MSRSYKKHPVYKDKYGGSDGKTIAAQRLRRIPLNSTKEETLINSPSAFKKVNKDSYDINDYIDRQTKEEAIEYYYANYAEENGNNKYYPTLEEFLDNWEKNFHRK